jgi:hypothetical protein
MWNPLLLELIAAERQRELLAQAEHGRTLRMLGSQKDSWHTVRTAIGRALIHCGAWLAGATEEEHAQLVQRLLCHEC